MTAINQDELDGLVRAYTQTCEDIRLGRPLMPRVPENDTGLLCDWRDSPLGFRDILCEARKDGARGITKWLDAHQPGVTWGSGHVCGDGKCLDSIRGQILHPDDPLLNNNVAETGGHDE